MKYVVATMVGEGGHCFYRFRFASSKYRTTSHAALRDSRLDGLPARDEEESGRRLAARPMKPPTTD